MDGYIIRTKLFADPNYNKCVILSRKAEIYDQFCNSWNSIWVVMPRKNGNNFTNPLHAELIDSDGFALFDAGPIEKDIMVQTDLTYMQDMKGLSGVIPLMKSPGCNPNSKVLMGGHRIAQPASPWGITAHR